MPANITVPKMIRNAASDAMSTGRVAAAPMRCRSGGRSSSTDPSYHGNARLTSDFRYTTTRDRGLVRGAGLARHGCMTATLEVARVAAHIYNAEILAARRS